MAENSDRGEAFPQTLPYKIFKQRHPDYNAGLWSVYRALYEGGEAVEDPKMLRKLLPQHSGEEDEVYKKRLEFALYIPYAGQIIDFIIAALSSDPITMEAEPKCDDWYHEFYEDTSAPGGREICFEELLRKQMLTALICRRSWMLVDLPNVFDRETQASNLAEQESAGALDAYLVSVEPENVIDWEETDDGLLEWALVYRKEKKRDGLMGNRDMAREEFTYFTDSEWARYAIEWDTTKQSEPDEDALVTREDGGPHTFGRVPLLPLELSSGLHAMGKIKALAKSHFNKRSALDWGEYRSLFQFLVAKLGAGDPLNAVTDDANRAVNQRIGHGRVMVLGEKDSLEYMGPDSGPFTVAMADLNNLRDEMHRVLHHMALSVDNSAAALQRSGASKAQDSAATTIVLKALGHIMRDYAEDLYNLVAKAHGDEDKYEWHAKGLEEFEAMSVPEMLQEAATLAEINIPSQTWKQTYLYKLAKLSLGGGVKDDLLEQIKDELEENISAEDFMFGVAGTDTAPTDVTGAAQGKAPSDAVPAAKMQAAKAAKPPKAKPPTAKAAKPAK